MVGRPGKVIIAVVVWAISIAVPIGQSTPPAQPAGAVITGSVVDSSLSVLPGVKVTLLRAEKTIASVVTNSEGKFRFDGVAPGDYRVRAELGGFPTLTRDLPVRAGVKSLQLPLVLGAPAADAVETKAAASPAASGRGVAPAMPPPPAQGAGGAGGGRGGGVGQGQGGAMGAGGYGPQRQSTIVGLPQSSMNITIDGVNMSDRCSECWYPIPRPGESYLRFNGNRFHATSENPLSTFGADVDTASYSNVRRFLSAGQLPPRDAVRVEELINYFHFDYPDPRGTKPVAVTTQVGDCPWAPSHKLVLIGAKARPSADREIAGRSIVLLVDVSGSMQSAERLPLIKTALGMFVDTLRADDRLAIVTYAGTSGVALPSTPMRFKDRVHAAIDGLYASGSTNGGEGLIMAYRIARSSFVPGGVNRVILATDGDFNVGITSQTQLVHLIDNEKESGVFLSVLGVGTGNLKDSTMELLADHGNGHYSYIDSLQEARRVLVREGDATLETVAKDVKFQIEFNPSAVTAWRLIGYEDRALAARDFNNDRKDGGEMGAGHTVTVLYEIVPVGAAQPDDVRAGDRLEVDPLKYQQSDRPAPKPPVTRPTSASTSGELLTVKVRYKMPDANESDLIEQAVRPGGRAPDLPFAAAVAEFGLLLRDAQSPQDRWTSLVQRLKTIEAPTSRASDREALADLVELAAALRRGQSR